VIKSDNGFDPAQKEAALQAESQSWDTANVQPAAPGDIPVIDVSDYFLTGKDAALQAVARDLRAASRDVGFYSLVGHGITKARIDEAVIQARRFHRLPIDTKNALLMDQPQLATGGAGYLPFKNRKLPQRPRGNENEAFIVKRDRTIALSDNPWPNENDLPGFRESVEQYAGLLEELALKLLPVYASALRIDKDFFAPAFTDPFIRLRMTRYPAIRHERVDHYGIAPHVDTTFFTLLVQDSAGLCVFSEKRGCWLFVPMIEGAFVVNTGELLKHWSNDEFVSTKHFANNNTSGASRYSIPFFFNANTDYPMNCIPSCCGPDRPAKYPAISYAESQGVTQGE
jgi:isopenicillin N synthase-like dioxygenase